MSSIPITFAIDFGPDCNERTRRWLFQDFAEHGARHMVLSDQMLGMIMQDPDLAETFTKELHTFGLDWMDSHSTSGLRWDLNCPEKTFFKRLMARKKLELQIAADMGIKTMTIHIGNDRPPYDKLPIPDHLDTVRRSLEELLPYAESCDVAIAIENTWFNTTIPENLLAIKKEFPTPYLGLCYDAGHANMVARNPNLTTPNDGRILEKMQPEIISCHLHDNDGTSDQHRSPGFGNVDWPHVRELLLTAPKLRVIQCETIPLLMGYSAKSMCDGMQKFFGSSVSVETVPSDLQH